MTILLKKINYYYYIEVFSLHILNCSAIMIFTVSTLRPCQETNEAHLIEVELNMQDILQVAAFPAESLQLLKSVCILAPPRITDRQYVG